MHISIYTNGMLWLQIASLANKFALIGYVGNPISFILNKKFMGSSLIKSFRLTGVYMIQGGKYGGMIWT